MTDVSYETKSGMSELLRPSTYLLRPAGCVYCGMAQPHSEADCIARLLEMALARTMRDVPNRLSGAYIKDDGDAA